MQSIKTELIIAILSLKQSQQQQNIKSALQLLLLIYLDFSL